MVSISQLAPFTRSLTAFTLVSTVSSEEIPSIGTSGSRVAGDTPARRTTTTKTANVSFHPPVRVPD